MTWMMWKYEVVAADWKRANTIQEAEILVLNALGQLGFECIDVDRDHVGRFTLLTFKKQLT